MALRKFDMPPNTAVFVCGRVAEGAVVLHVVRDGEGQWSFLCGEDHSEEEPKLVSLRSVLEKDPTLNELADLAWNESAMRHTHKHPWVRHDDYEDIILENIEEFGWHVVLVPDDEEGPGFAYSIGQEPEVIVFGLPPDLMHAIVNAAGEAEEIKPDIKLEGYLERHPVIFKRVDKARYKDFLGYAMWYHEGANFDVLQCVWPDMAGKFPWDPGFNPKVVQPLLFRGGANELARPIR